MSLGCGSAQLNTLNLRAYTVQRRAERCCLLILTVRAALLALLDQSMLVQHGAVHAGTNSSACCAFPVVQLEREFMEMIKQ